MNKIKMNGNIKLVVKNISNNEIISINKDEDFELCEEDEDGDGDGDGDEDQTKFSISFIENFQKKHKIELPNSFLKYPEDIQISILQYLDQLSFVEKKAYMIAKNHLGSSFHILKSNGYIDWKSKNKK
jgi:hypothetical protein